MKLSNRLLTVASFVKEHANVADVGADHGLIEKYLIDNHIVDSLLAIENKIGPYKTLENNLKSYNVKLSLSNGISDIDEKVDTLIIAGMGGNLIVGILKDNLEKLANIKQIVVDAHRDIELVRREICLLGFKIEKEKIVFENDIYYFVISFVKGHKDYDDIVYEWGYRITNDTLFDEFRNKTLETLNINLIHFKSSERANKNIIKEKEEKIRRLINL